MHAHFSVMPSGGMKAAIPKIVAQAKADPSILVLEDGKASYALAFCLFPETCVNELRRYQTSGQIGPSICVLTVDEHGIFVNQECGDDSLEGLAEFVKWVLREFAPCRVFDDDANEDISALAATDPGRLFSNG